MIRNFEYLIVFTGAPGVLPEQNDRYRIQSWKVNEIKAYKNDAWVQVYEVYMNWDISVINIQRQESTQSTRHKTLYENYVLTTSERWARCQHHGTCVCFGTTTVCSLRHSLSTRWFIIEYKVRVATITHHHNDTPYAILTLLVVLAGKWVNL